MYIKLLFALILILILPLAIKKVENNLELFLFIMGIYVCIISKSFSVHFISQIFTNHFLYIITGTVVTAGFLFKYINKYIKNIIDSILCHISIKIFVFFMIVLIGLVSSIITAVVSALLLTEIIEMIPVSRQNKIKINIISCFSIGLGAILMPMGEPLSTIVATKLNLNFWYIFIHIWMYIIPGILILGLLGSIYAKKCNGKDDNKLNAKGLSNIEIILKAAKIFIFIIALDMLGTGFKPLVDMYIIKLDGRLLYWINISSAVLDNATLAAAEISMKMTEKQITSILIGLLVSGSMMIPGNIPNIISASKLKIKSSEWVKLAIPLGLGLMIMYYIVLFI